MEDLRRGPPWVWDGTLIVVGLGLSVIHLHHWTRETASLAIVIGVLIPLGISVGVIGVGLYNRRYGHLQPIIPLLVTWMLLSMVWMAIAGVGAILYQMSEDVLVSHSFFLVSIFATYGCIPGLLSGWYDAQRRQHRQTVSDREEQLAVLARILRHNLRNEMNVILGSAETIEENAPDEIAHHAAQIQDAGNTLIELTEKERVMVETLVDPLDKTAIDLDSLLSDTVERLQNTHPGAEIALAEDTLPEVRGVPDLDRAFEELIENGIIHNDSDPPTVSVTAEKTGDTVTIRITDNGPGISPDEVAVITGDTPVGPLQHGSGLGLRLADLIISQSNGDLEFTSSDSQGTEVRVTLPGT